MLIVMLPSLKSRFSLFCGGLRGRSRLSLQHLCLHSFPSFLQMWLHAHFPFSSLTGSSDVPSYLRFLGYPTIVTGSRARPIRFRGVSFLLEEIVNVDYLHAITSLSSQQVTHHR